jgi:hypothetical protein
MICWGRFFLSFVLGSSWGLIRSGDSLLNCLWFLAGGRGSRVVLSGHACKYVPVTLGVRHPCLSTVLTRPPMIRTLFRFVGGVESYRGSGPAPTGL